MTTISVTNSRRRSIWIDDNVDPMEEPGASFCARCGAFPLTVAEADAHTCR